MTAARIILFALCVCALGLAVHVGLIELREYVDRRVVRKLQDERYARARNAIHDLTVVEMARSHEQVWAEHAEARELADLARQVDAIFGQDREDA